MKTSISKSLQCYLSKCLNHLLKLTTQGRSCGDPTTNLDQMLYFQLYKDKFIPSRLEFFLVLSRVTNIQLEIQVIDSLT